jgi:type VI secretion system VasD/TssJ family lipoprotein
MSVEAGTMLRRRLLVSSHVAALSALFGWPLARGQSRATPRRLALVIGNARYPEVPLNNPTNDAKLMADTLQELGFEVTHGQDLRRTDFLQALLQFAKQIPPGADVLFYYAGHAVQIRGSNFLLPVDIQNLSDSDWVEQNAINLDDAVIRQLVRSESAHAGVRMLFIDACRDNPFATGRVAALTAGLASVQNSVSIGSGMLIASASLPNQPAEDGPPGGNSVFTAQLAKEMRVPGQGVETMLKNVRVQVDRATQRAQLPMHASTLTTEFVFNDGRNLTARAQIQAVLPALSASVTVRADAALNSDARKQQPRKAVMWIYVLRATSAFQKAGLEALYERAEATLGTDLLSSEKRTLTPGESFQMPLDMASTARAIGVLVAYREASADGYKALLPLTARDSTTGPATPLQVRIDAGARSVSIALAG